MKVPLIILVSLLIHINVFSQNNSIPISKPYVIPAVGEQLLIELKSALLDYPYTKTELIEIYGPDDQLLSADMLEVCQFDQCFAPTEASDIEFMPTAPEGILNGEENNVRHAFPLGITPKRELPHGNYVLVVRDKDTQKVIHRRILTLIHPEPIINKITIRYPDGVTANNLLTINPNHDLKKVQFELEGEHLDNEFKSVSIQGLALKKVVNTSNTYVSENDWTASKLKSINLEDPKLSIERYNVTETYTTGIKLKVMPPVITDNLVKKINAGQSRFLLTLNVSNLFPRAQLKLAEFANGNVLAEEDIYDGATVDIKSGTIAQYVLFSEGALNSGNARFTVQVINRDGGESKVETIQIQVQEAAVIALPLISTKPFMEEVPTMVKFTRSDNAAAFQFTGDVILALNGTHLLINPRNMDGALNQFSAEVVFPEGVDASIPFELQNNGNSWKGYFEGIIDKPKVEDDFRAVQAGSSFVLHINGHSDKLTAILRSEDKGVKLTDNDFKDGAIEIRVDKKVPAKTTFSVVMYYQDHALETLTFKVEDWPKPEDIAEFNIGDVIYPVNTKTRLVLLDESPIVLQSKKNALENATSNLTVQLIKANGTKLGTPQSFIYDDDQKIARTELSPYGFGLGGGDEFMIELLNPLSQPVIQRGYVKRKFSERLLANAGVSAVSIFFKERLDENGVVLPKTTLISGVNLGVYYLPENLWDAGGKRPFGFGLNLMAQEESNTVKVRLGTSALLFETLSVGLSFGQSQMAFFMGANISFLDFTKVFKRRK